MKSDTISLTFAALADPTRRAILVKLASGEQPVSDLAKPFLKSMSLPAITKHLQVLERAGLITKGRQAQWRPCRINGDGLRDAAEWMDEVRAHWEASFDRLDHYLQSLQAQSPNPSAKSAQYATQKKSSRSQRTQTRPSSKKGPRHVGQKARRK
ncbi:MAG TPA: metalloregulator ArsR/SmtB family transcription factor [Pseudobdellovibrionaceae bacterium]|nr:metalloregulator ArsR/SmtB family transcription factor [Pseudobdellovibrionaceae bacterium]